jgi:hypothetical protein
MCEEHKMTVVTYKSNLKPEITITESINDQYTSYLYKGFASFEDANDYAISWQDVYEFGYFGSAFAEMTPQGPIVWARRRNSCD